MKFVENVRGMVHVTRWPLTTRSSRIMTTMWAVSLAFALVSIVANMVLGQFASPVFIGVILLAALDIYMLANAIQGLLFRRHIDRAMKGLYGDA